MKPVGKPDAGNPHVRFDERGGETGLRQRLKNRASPRLYKSAGISVPAEFISKRSVLLEGRDAGLREHVVLRAGTATHADGADHLAADDQRITAARCDDVIER